MERVKEKRIVEALSYSSLVKLLNGLFLKTIGLVLKLIIEKNPSKFVCHLSDATILFSKNQQELNYGGYETKKQY